LEKKKDETKIPVLQEELKVEKRTVETGVTRVKKSVHEREEIVDEPLVKEEAHVERVPINRYVEGPVPVREEDGVTIVPLFEEVLVIEKKLLLKEELRITKHTKTVRDPQRVIVRSEEAVVESDSGVKDAADLK
jgi:uncharacterized protein (TIGR02271 family)